MENCNNVPKVPFDPGWNDPPTFSYNAQQTTPNRPRNFLNKRVAFPLSGTSLNPTPSPTVTLPPMPSIPGAPSIPLQPPPKSINATTEDVNDVNIDSDSALLEVKEILLRFLEDNSELGAKANDIRKRINTMEQMWSSGKLDKQIHVQMNKLAIALRDNQPSVADEVHRALMVDHVSAVGTWMPGIKQLIHHCQAKSELLAIDSDTDTAQT